MKKPAAKKRRGLLVKGIGAAKGKKAPTLACLSSPKTPTIIAKLKLMTKTAKANGSDGITMDQVQQAISSSKHIFWVGFGLAAEKRGTSDGGAG